MLPSGSVNLPPREAENMIGGKEGTLLHTLKIAENDHIRHLVYLFVHVGVFVFYFNYLIETRYGL